MILIHTHCFILIILCVSVNVLGGENIPAGTDNLKGNENSTSITEMSTTNYCVYPVIVNSVKISICLIKYLWISICTISYFVATLLQYNWCCQGICFCKHQMSNFFSTISNIFLQYKCFYEHNL